MGSEKCLRRIGHIVWPGLELSDTPKNRPTVDYFPLRLWRIIEREVQACGRDARGRCRWVCLGCGRTFGASTGTVLGRSGLDRVTWHAYAGAMLAGASPGACASAAGGLAQDQLLHEAQALRGHGPHDAGPRGAAWVQGARRRPRRPRLSRVTTYWVETQTAGVGEGCLDNARCPCIGIRLNGSKTTLTTVYLLSLP